MATSKNECVRLRDYGFHKDVELPSADQAIVVSSVLSKAKRKIARLLGIQHLASRVPDLGLDAPATDCPHHRAVFAHQKLGALIARNRPFHLNDRRECALLPQLA